MQRQDSITPVVNPFEAPTSHNGFFSVLKMVIVGLVLFVPRCIFTILIVLSMYCYSLFACTCCCQGEQTVPESEGGPTYPKYPAARTCLRFIIRAHVRLLLLVWGYYWISVDRSLEKQKTPEGHPEPGIIIANHTSIVEPLVLFYLESCVLLGKAEIVKAPVFGRIFEALQFLAVHRESAKNRHGVANEISRRARWSLDQPKEVLEEHGTFEKLLIFPEGTCTNGNAVITFKHGAFRPLCPVRCISVSFPSFWCDISYTGPLYLGGVICRMFCQVYNRCEVKYLGDIQPPSAPNQQQQVEPMRAASPDSSASSPEVPILQQPEEVEVLPASPLSASDGGAHHRVEQFASECQQLFAQGLGVPITAHSFDDYRLDLDAYVLFGGNVVLSRDLQIGPAKLEFKKARALLKEFAKFNERRDGQMTKKEFRKFMQLEDKPEIADAVFKRWNADRDNDTIDFKEFFRTSCMTKLLQLRSQVAVAQQEGGHHAGVAVEPDVSGGEAGAGDMIRRSSSDGELHDAFTGLFYAFDSDLDGVLTKAEFVLGMSQVACGVRNDKLGDLFDEVDKNRSGTIEVEEFLQYCKEHDHFMKYVTDFIAKNNVVDQSEVLS